MLRAIYISKRLPCLFLFIEKLAYPTQLFLITQKVSLTDKFVRMGFEIGIKDAQAPLVIGLDVGSTASRGMLYDAAGRPAGSRSKKPHSFTTNRDGTSTIDADQVVDELSEIICDLIKEAKGRRIQGVSLDTFSSSLVGVDKSGNAITPCFTYADSRCASQVKSLRDELDEDELQQRTGARLHSSYLPARFRWLRQECPDLFEKADRWIALGAYVFLKLTGEAVIGTSAAAWTGLLNRATGDWDDQILDLLDLDKAKLSRILNPNEPLFPSQHNWDELRGAAWFAPIADGHAANLGAGAVGVGELVCTLATSGAARVIIDDPVGSALKPIPSGLWCYRLDANTSLLGGAMNDCGRAFTWAEREFTEVVKGGDEALLRADPSPHSPVVLPFFTGERSTGWRGDARVVMSGISFSTSGSDIFRGVMEGVGLQYLRIINQLRQVAGNLDAARTAGSMTRNLPGIVTLLADVMQMELTPVTIKRSTLHGTALLALDTLAPDVERAKVDVGEVAKPRPENAEHYRKLMETADEMYASFYG